MVIAAGISQKNRRRFQEFRIDRAGAERRFSESRPLNEFELSRRHPAHPQQQPAVLKTADFGRSVSARIVTNGHLDDFQIQANRPENQIEIAERIEIAEIFSFGG